MVRLTDFLKKGQRVEAGQLIGHVGNTGNSACNHLHITIITPDGVLIDPYTYLLEVMPD
jgi:murein DD-endopeptidase MepM/ murein hydrolase activator NlpD